MRRILGTIGVVAVSVVAGVAIANLGDGARVYQATVDPAVAPGASAKLQVSDDGATLVAEGLPEPPEGRAYRAWIRLPGQEPQPKSILFEPREPRPPRPATSTDRGGRAAQRSRQRRRPGRAHEGRM